MSDTRTVVAVLVDGPDDRPPFMAEIEDRAEVRYTEAGGLGHALTGADVLFLWDFFSGALRDAWPHADRLRWVHIAAAGVDTLLFDELRDSDVVVTNARGAFDDPIAEFALASVLAHAKQLHRSRDLQREHVWQHRETHMVRGQRAVIVGTGAIGRATARLLTAVGMEVYGAGRTARPHDADFGHVVASAELADQVGDADHVIVTAPLTKETRALVDGRVLTAMKPTAHLVNVARGPVVDEAALVAALREGAIAGASLDVFDTEPLPEDSPLWDMPNVAVSAHMSGDVVGWRATLARQFLDNVRRYLDGADPATLVNVVDRRLGFVAAS